MQELKKLNKYQKLECVSLGDNEINTIEDVKDLAQFEYLVQLDFSGTKFSESKNYRKEVFETFANLVILDDKDVNG